MANSKTVEPIRQLKDIRHINLRGNYAAHTLWKTWGFHQRVTFGVDIPTLMEAYNHSNQRQTLAYLCVQTREVHDCFQNVIG